MIMCAALKGTVMHKVKCSIYDKRPHACKTAVVPGDSTCRFLRIKVKEALEDEAKTKTG
jgi:Fe-S-cluster containining protein